MNAATFLSFVGLLALVSMSEADGGRSYAKHAYVSNVDMREMAKKFQSQVPRIPERVRNRLLGVLESQMILTSLGVPNDTSSIKVTDSKGVINLALVIPEITANFLLRDSPVTQPQDGGTRYQYAFQQIDVQLQVVESSKKTSQVESAKIIQFEPRSVEVRRFLKKSLFKTITLAKGESRYKDIMALAKRYIPAGFTKGPIVKEFAQSLLR